MPMSVLHRDGNKSDTGGQGKVKTQKMWVAPLPLGYRFGGEVEVEGPQTGDGTLFSRAEVEGAGELRLQIYGHMEPVHFGFFVEANSYVRTSSSGPALGCNARLDAGWEVRAQETNQLVHPPRTVPFNNIGQEKATWLDESGFDVVLQPGIYEFRFELDVVAEANSSEYEQFVYVNLLEAKFMANII